MARLNLIEIFRAGRHVSANGETISFSEQDVQELAASYDPALHKAPLVVGHPKDNTPSFGRAASLGVVGTKLFASCDEIDASFREAVNAKRYPKVSASIYKRASPNNPTPGKLYLRHIGFLGGMPPAVKGLEDASFAGGADDFVTFEFAEADAAKPNPPPPPDASGGAQAQAGDKQAPPTPPANPALEAFLKALNVDDATRTKLTEVIAPILDAAKAPPETANHAERRQALEAGERELAKRQAAQRRSENKSFLGELRGRGVMLPASEKLVLSFMDLLAAPQAVVSFGENETRQADQIFREDFLAKIKPTVDFRELSQLGDDDDGERDDAISLSEAAQEYMRDQKSKGRIVHAADAVTHVQRQRSKR